MLKDITIKKKLIISFSLISILVAILAAYSIFSINKSADGFTSYREMAKDSVLAGRIQANMLMIRMNVKDYLTTKSQKDIDQFNDYFDQTSKFIEIAKKEIRHPQRAKIIQKIDQELVSYNENFYKVIDFMKKRDEVKINNLDTNGKKAEQLLTAVSKSATKDGDLQAGVAAGANIRSLLLARLYTAKFLDSNSKEDMDRVLSEFSELHKEIKALRNEIQNPTRKAQLAEAITLTRTYEQGVKQIRQIIIDRNRIIKNKLDVIGPNIADITEDMKRLIIKEQLNTGSEIDSLNSNIILISIIVALVILAISIVLAIIIPRDISTLIEKFQTGLLGFFQYLNKENDNANTIDIDSNDEIGSMTKVVNENIIKTREIIDADKLFLDDVARVVKEVGQGRMNQRIEKSTPSENLMELKKIFNNMLEVTTTNVCEDINKINRVLESFSRLDFRDRVENDIGGVAKGLNNLAEIINEMLKENKANGLSLDQSSNILLKNVDILNTNSNEAAAALEETAAALEEITSNIASNTNNIVQMASIANEVTNSATEGGKISK